MRKNLINFDDFIVNYIWKDSGMIVKVINWIFRTSFLKDNKF